MKKTIAVITLILAFILSGNAGAQNNLEAYIALPGINVTHIDGIDYVHREQKLHVKLGSLDYLPDFERFLEAMNASISRPFNRLNWGVIKLEENVDLKMAIGILKDHQLVEYAEPLVVAFAGSLPNDPDIHMQWYIRNTGQSPTNGTPGASAHFANAWMLTTGSSNVAVGVLDTGIAMQNGQLSHPDLQNTSRIIPRLNLVDPNDPEGLRDTDGHGTFVAGIIGAEANNQVGIAGVSPDSKLLIYKTSKMTDAGHLQDALIDLHDWATTTGDRVILNYSYGTQTPTQGLFDAVEYSSQNEILLVTITHNIVRFNEITYPAKYADQFSNVLAVGGTNKNDLQDVGITGPEVTIAAPAGTIDGCTDTSGIFSTMPNYNVTMNESASGDPWDCAHNMHFSFSVGTSYAAPQVAGAAALLLSMDSTLTPEEIRDLLTTSADKVGGYNYNWNSSKPGHSEELGYGRLNAFKAVVNTLPNQYHSHFFAHSGTVAIDSALIHGESYLEFGTLSIPANSVTVIDGNFIGFGSTWAKMQVNGVLIITEGTTVSDMSFEVKNGGKLIILNDAYMSNVPILVESGGNMEVRDGATIRPGSLGELLVEGYARLGSDVVVRRGDIEVGAGGELVVGAGSTLYFNSGASLTSYGKVELGSHAGADVILARDPNVGGTWAGVHLNGAGADGSVFHRTRVEGAVNGITITNAGSVTLNQTRAEDNTWDGIRLINTATGWLEWVTATGNGRYGIYIDGGTPGNISSTLLADNINAGINIEGAGWIWDIQTSRIRDNASQGLWARDAAFLGINFSSIHDNANYNAASWSGAEIIAWDNWWGQAPPDPNGFHTMTGGTLDYSSWLSQDPNQGILSVSEGETLASVQDPSGQKPRIPPKPELVRTLSDLRAELFHTPASERLARVEELSADMDPAWQPWAQVVGLEMLQQAGRHRDLVQAGGIVLAEAGLPAGVRRTIARRMFYSYLLGLQDAGQARAMIGLLEDLECEEAGSGQLSWLADFHGARFAESDEEPSLVLESGQSDLQVSNHPNPFNPVTTLRYTLPEAGEASLSVYNIQGQRVAALVTGLHSQGTHTIGFDASRLASGVYLYRLTTSAGIVTGKMLLIK